MTVEDALAAISAKPYKHRWTAAENDALRRLYPAAARVYNVPQLVALWPRLGWPARTVGQLRAQAAILDLQGGSGREQSRQ